MNWLNWIHFTMMGELADEFIFNYISVLEFLTLLICNMITIKKDYREAH